MLTLQLHVVVGANAKAFGDSDLLIYREFAWVINVQAKPRRSSPPAPAHQGKGHTI